MTPPSSSPLSGRLGAYELLSELGRGGMGVVYRARAADGREVALKVLRRAGDPEAARRFSRESRLLESLGEAEGFVPLLDAGEAEGWPYLVMPLVRGGTLRARLDRGPLAVEDAVALASALAAALGRAHEKGIVHRDLKPENVLFASDGRALVADLGLAKHFRGDAPALASASLSRTGEVRGTLGYLAPEQLASAKHVLPAADVFSLGVVLYECLAGAPPFEGETLLELAAKTTDGRFARLASRCPGVPPGVAAVVERALAPRPEGRFADGAELARALDACRGAAARSRRAALVVVSAAVALVGAAAVAALSTRPAPRRSSPTPPPATLAAPSARADAPEAPVERVLREARAGALAGAARRKAELDLLFSRRDGRLAERIARALDEVTRAISPGKPLEPTDAALASFACEALGRLGLAEVAVPALGRYVARERDQVRALAAGEALLALGDGAALAVLRDALSRFEPGGAFSKRIAPALVVPGREPRTAYEHVDRASARSEAGDLDGAIQDLSRAVELDPGYAVAWNNRGVARGRKGDREGAIADHTRAIELEPTRATAWRNRGISLTELGSHEAAIAELTRAIELDPSDPSAWSSRGVAKASLDDVDGAIADLGTAIGLDPRFFGAWSNRGLARVRKGDLDGAIADITRAIELDARSAASFGARGLAWKRKGDLDGAIADFTRAIELAPKHPLAWGARGVARESAGDRAGAAKDLERYLELAPGGPQAPAARRRLAELRRSP